MSITVIMQDATVLEFATPWLTDAGTSTALCLAAYQAMLTQPVADCQVQLLATEALAFGIAKYNYLPDTAACVPACAYGSGQYMLLCVK